MSGKKQHNGFSLRVFNFWMVVAAVIMTALMVYSIYRLSSSFLRMTHATESHIAMGKAATKLMDASDYLTEKAQRFAGTGVSPEPATCSFWKNILRKRKNPQDGKKPLIR